ncbi:MAG: hypothetical protein JWP27_2434 [Flaviaesturariibacter sp.]|nr:hypothetical protein [Flaviaesturariibacter sp.]
MLLWGCWGFALGTLLLLGPMRWLLNYARLHSWSDRKETIMVVACIGLLVVVTFMIAWWSRNLFSRSTSTAAQVVLVTVPVLSAAFAMYAFMHPTWINSGKQESFGKGFTIGAYPEEKKLQSLKEEGYTTVVSLLHPAVVPFEPRLIAQEKEAAARVGIRLVHIPMLPWITDNRASLDSLRRFVASSSGKIFIHCYLGKDRVNLARRIIEQASGTAAAMEKGTSSRRKLSDISRFERGTIYQLEPGVFLTPMPTKEEYLGYVMSSNVKQVVNLINTKDPEAQALIEEERKNLEAIGVAYKVYNVNESTRPEAMIKIAADVRAMPRPLLVHPFFSDSTEGSLFRKQYETLLK